MIKLTGTWKKGTTIDKYCSHSSSKDAPYAYIKGNAQGVNFFISKPGMHAFHYSILPSGEILFDEYKWEIRKKLKGMGITAKVEDVEDGYLYSFDGVNLKKVEVDQKVKINIRHDITMEQAKKELFALLKEVTKEICDSLESKKVLATLTAGTDSTLMVLLLRECGINVHAVCVGRTPNDFDPLWAKKHAAQLKVPYTFIPLPTSDAHLNKLAYDTIAIIEFCEMSNTLMGMCTKHLLNYSEINFPDRKVIFKGHYADELFANLMTTSARYLRFCNDKPTNETWSEYRVDSVLHQYPNDVQVSKIIRKTNFDWRSVFTHKKVIEFIFSMPIHICPYGKDKKQLLWAILDDHIKDGVWRQKRKVGYYTGTGIGKIRLENPVLQDDNFRRLYQIAQSQSK